MMTVFEAMANNFTQKKYECRLRTTHHIVVHIFVWVTPSILYQNARRIWNSRLLERGLLFHTVKWSFLLGLKSDTKKFKLHSTRPYFELGHDDKNSRHISVLDSFHGFLFKNSKVWSVPIGTFLHSNWTLCANFWSSDTVLLWHLWHLNSSKSVPLFLESSEISASSTFF